jgi:hypothetical protein
MSCEKSVYPDVSVSAKPKFIAQSIDQLHWYPAVWSDYAGCYVEMGTESSFSTPEKAIAYAKKRGSNYV